MPVVPDSEGRVLRSNLVELARGIRCLVVDQEKIAVQSETGRRRSARAVGGPDDGVETPVRADVERRDGVGPLVHDEQESPRRIRDHLPHGVERAGLAGVDRPGTAREVAAEEPEVSTAEAIGEDGVPSRRRSVRFEIDETVESGWGTASV